SLAREPHAATERKKRNDAQYSYVSGIHRACTSRSAGRRATGFHTPPSRHGERDGSDGDKRGDERNVEHLQPGTEACDLQIEAATHIAQLLADTQSLLLEAHELRFLLWGEHERAFGVTTGLELGKLTLGFPQFPIKLLLLCAQLIVGLATQLLDLGEGAEEALATANADRVAATGEIVERVGDKVAIVCPCDGKPLSKQALRAKPKRIGKDVGVGDDDQVRRVSRLSAMCACGLVVFFFRARFTIGVRRLELAANARRDG